MFGRNKQSYTKKEKKKTRRDKDKKKATGNVVAATAVAKTSGKVSYTSDWKKGKKLCHTDPCEIIPNLWLGSAFAERSIMRNCSVLVPLNDLHGSLWDEGWRGDIIYVPITDFKALPIEVLYKYAEIVALEYQKGESIGIFCVGGHGRTGYFASAVLWCLGIPQAEGFADPIGFLRAKYCKSAVESVPQYRSLEAFTGVSGLCTKYDDYVSAGFKYKSYGKSAYVYGDGCYDDVFYDEWQSKGKVDSCFDPCFDCRSESCVGCTHYISASAVDKEVYTIHSDPCWDCVHGDDIIENNVYKLECDMGNKVGQLCDDFFPWTKQDSVEQQEELVWVNEPEEKISV